MRQIGMHEVQANFVNLVEQAANGEAFIIVKSER